nr:hypothetical protein [Chloracidobacterium aggregatum]
MRRRGIAPPGRQVGYPGGDGGQPVAQLDAQAVGHHAAVGKAGGIDALWVRLPGFHEVVNQRPEEADIVHVGVAACAAEGLATSVIPLPVHAGRIDGDEAFLFAKPGKTKAAFQLFSASAAAAVQHEDDWRGRRGQAAGPVEVVGTCQTAV